MNILVIGNGFDLAHGLPTTYTDFLNFANVLLVRTGKKGREEDIVLPDMVENYINSLITNNSKIDVLNEYIEMLDGNIWLNHFNHSTINEGWIDFEKEISTVIQALDAARKSVFSQNMIDRKEYFPLEQWQLDKLHYLMGYDEVPNKNSYNVYLEFFQIMPEKMYADLNKLIRALELYFCDFVNTIDIKNKKKDIDDLKVDNVLSFNYTNTYERIYDEAISCSYDYIHGKAKEDSSISNCNLVLGIDEYLYSPERELDNEYIRFKKFFQRILKKTGCDYASWAEYIEKDYALSGQNSFCNILYIYGHSLDVTDKDVISRLIRAGEMKTYIYYHNEEAYANQIANLVKVLGEEELIRRVHGLNPSIRFIEHTD